MGDEVARKTCAPQGGLKVLLVITGMGMGGAEQVVAVLADKLVAEGCDVILAYLTGASRVRPSRSEVRLIALEMGSPWRAGRAYRKLRKLVRTFRPDIVHAHMFHAVMLVRALRLSMPVPCIISTVHTGSPRRGLRALWYRVSDRLTDLSTAPSLEAMDAFVASGAVPRARMVVAQNGIDVERFRYAAIERDILRASLSIEPECRVLLAVGRLDRSKDYPNLFAALAQLPSSLRFQLLIAGSGPLAVPLTNLADQLGLSSRVTFLGVRRDVPALMSAADLFVLPSIQESFGLVVGEAMACERVVVATDSGGVREVLGACGFLVPTQAPAALAAALSAALALTPVQARRLGKAARQRILGRYSQFQSLARWREIYDIPRRQDRLARDGRGAAVV